MAPHFSTLAWKIPWTEEPGGLQSMGLLRVRLSLSLFTFMHWRRKWQPTPVFSPGESQGQGSLVGCHLWGCTELDMTEVTQQQQQQPSLIILARTSGYFVELHLYFYLMDRVSFLKPQEPTSASFKPFFCSFLTSLSLQNLKALGPSSRFNFGF